MAGTRDRGNSIPIYIKIIYTVLYLALVYYTVQNYSLLSLLWFSQIGLFIVFIGMWGESKTLISMASLSILLFHSIWTAGFLIRLIAGINFVGGLDYMFNPGTPLFLKILSSYHLVMPFMLLWLLKRKGYDPRAFKLQMLLGWLIMILSFLFTPVSRNINWVFGLVSPQNLISPYSYLIIVMALLPLVVYLPTHIILKKMFYRR